MGAWPHHLSWFNNRASPPSKYTRAQRADTTQRSSHTERDGWQTLFSCSCSPMAALLKSCQSSLQSADAARRTPSPRFLLPAPQTLILFSLLPTVLLTRPFCSPLAAVSSQFSAAARKSSRWRRLSASPAPTCILNGFSSVCACVYALKNSPAPPNRT